MKLPKYPLQVVLDKRRRLEDKAKDFLKKRREELEIEIKKLEKLQQELKLIKQKQEETRQQLLSLPPNVAIKDIQSLQSYLKKLKYDEQKQLEKIMLQKKEIQKAEQRVQEAKKALLDAMKAVKAVLQHKEKWEKEIKRERAKKEQKLQNEIGNVLYIYKDKI